MAASSLFFGLPQSFSLLLLLLQSLGGGSQELEVLQTQGPVRLTAGETLTLNCTLIGSGPPGGVRWYKGADQGQAPVYTTKVTTTTPRVTRIDPVSNTDYSIRISDIQPKDAGTYYCVKYQAGKPETLHKQGKGTKVSVMAKPSHPSIGGPPSRVDPGANVIFNCTSEGFFPRDITLTWRKDGTRIEATKTDILPPGESTSYNVESTLKVSLTEKDVKSELTCEIQHSTLSSLLSQSFKLGDALQVAPKVSVEPGHLVDTTVNSLVMITCHAKSFYPNDTSLVWKENGSETDPGVAEPVTQDGDGTFSVKSSLEVNATEQRNSSVFTCHAVRNSQSSGHINVTLRIHRDSHSAAEGQWLLSQPGFWVVYVLNKTAAAFFLFFFFLRKMPSKTNQGHMPRRVQERGLQEAPVQQ